MFGLTGMNSFHASVKNAFQPSLSNARAYILTNKEGSVIACSKEAKKYIKIGETCSKIKHQQYPVKILFISINLCELLFHE